MKEISMIAKPGTTQGLNRRGSKTSMKESQITYTKVCDTQGDHVPGSGNSWSGPYLFLGALLALLFPLS